MNHVGQEKLGTGHNRCPPYDVSLHELTLSFLEAFWKERSQTTFLVLQGSSASLRGKQDGVELPF